MNRNSFFHFSGIVFVVFFFAVFLSNAYVYAQSPANVFPTLFCLGSCPLSKAPPTDAAISPSNSVSSKPVPKTPALSKPCAVTQVVTQRKSEKKHGHKNGAVSNLIAQLLELLITLLKQLLGGTIPPPPIGQPPSPDSSPIPCPVSPLPSGQTPQVTSGNPTGSAPTGAIGTKPGGNLNSFFSPDFSGSPFCLFSHQVYTISAKVMTVSYPKGSSAQSAGAPFGGAQICLPFTAGFGTDAVLSYWVRIPVGFQFVKGGKLPGLYGGVEPFSGGKHNPNGWSMRLMWRANGTGEVYGYIATTSGYGNDWGLGNFTWLADGQWHQVTEHMHLNTPGNSDGWVSLSYNGKEVINQTGLAITTTNTKIGGLFFSTFYGGHDASWAPTANERIDFMGFKGNVH